MQIDLIQMIEAVSGETHPSVSATAGSVPSLGESGFALVFAQMRAQLLGQLAGDIPVEPVENRPDDEMSPQELSWLSMVVEQWMPPPRAITGAEAGDALVESEGPEAGVSINGSMTAVPAAVARQGAAFPQFSGFEALQAELMPGAAEAVLSSAQDAVLPAAIPVDAGLTDFISGAAAEGPVVCPPSLVAAPDVLFDAPATVGDVHIPGSDDATTPPEVRIPPIRIIHAEYRVTAAPENAVASALSEGTVDADLQGPDLVVEIAGAEKAETLSVATPASAVSSVESAVLTGVVIAEAEPATAETHSGAVDAASRTISSPDAVDDGSLKTVLERLDDVFSEAGRLEVRSRPVDTLERSVATTLGRASGRRTAVSAAGKEAEALLPASRVEVAPSESGNASLSPAIPLEAVPRTEARAPNVEAPSSHATLETVTAHTVRNVRFLVFKGERTITVRLAPESLGEMRLDVQSSSDGLSIRLASANPVVRDALETQVHGLREALARDGISVAKVEIASTMSYMADSGSRFSQEMGQPPQAFVVRASLSAEHAYTNARAEESSALRCASLHDGPLNVFV